MNTVNIVIQGLNQLFYTDCPINDYQSLLDEIGFVNSNEKPNLTIPEIEEENRNRFFSLLKSSNLTINTYNQAESLLKRKDLKIYVSNKDSWFLTIDSYLMEMVNISTDIITEAEVLALPTDRTIIYKELNSDLKLFIDNGFWCSVISNTNLTFSNTEPLYGDKINALNNINSTQNWHFTSTYAFLDDIPFQMISTYITGDKFKFLKERLAENGMIKVFSFPLCKNLTDKMTEVMFFQSNSKIFFLHYFGSTAPASSCDLVVLKHLEKYYMPRFNKIHSNLLNLEDIKVIDSPENSETFACRSLMNKYIAGIINEGKLLITKIPKFKTKTCDLSSLAEMLETEEDLSFPLIVKFDAENRSLAHLIGVLPSKDLAKTFIERITERIDTTEFVVTVQEFRNHYGTLIKVFLMGEDVNVYTRPSLGEITSNSKVLVFQTSELNNLGERKILAVKDLNEEGLKLDAIRMSKISGKTLLGFDYLLDEQTGDYMLIDVNHFPKYSEVPNFRERFWDWLIEQAN